MTGTRRVCIVLILLALAPACAELDRVNEAARMQDRGDFAGAAALCEEVLDGSPSQEDVAYCRLFAGFSYFRLHQFDKALPHLRALTAFADLDPSFRKGGLMVAATLIELGRYEEAVHYAARSLAVAPDDSSAYSYRAAAYLGLGMYDAALADLQRLAAAPLPPRTAVKAHEGLAMVHAILGHRDEALAALERIPPLAPDYDAAEEQALVHLLLGDVEEARRRYERGPSLGLHLENERVLETHASATTVTRVLEPSPAHAAGLKPGDRILAVRGIPVRSVEEFTRVVSTLPHGLPVRLDISRGGQAMTVKARVQARRIDRDQLRRHPLLAAYWARRAALEEAEARSQRGDARGALQRLLDYSREWTPDSETVKRIVALVAGLDPRPAIPAEAARLAKEAERLQREAKDDAGLDAAIETYRRALRMAPWWPDPHLNLALLHEQRRDWGLAAAQLGAFVAAAPDAPEAEAARRAMFEMQYRVDHSR